MSFVPNLRTKRPEEEYVQSKIDVLVNYHDVLTAAEEAGGLVTGIDDPGSHRVAVVGTGPAGIVAAYELLRLGVTVDIFSGDHASYRYGRAFSHPFPGNEQYLAEMGAMRFPPSEAGMFFYMSKFDIKYNDNFPDPGKVTTRLYVNGQSFDWKAGQPAPSLFDTVTKGLDALIGEDTTLADGTVLKSPKAITGYMMDADFDSAQSAWQDWITHFEHLSFGAGLSVIFQLNPNAPGGTRWTDDDMAIFGTIGVGSGGFGPLYSVQFLEIFRLFVNELETDQQFIPTGIASLFDAMAHKEVGGTHVIARHIDEYVVKIKYVDDKQSTIELTSNVDAKRVYNRVIWAAPKWASQANTNLIEFLGTAIEGSIIRGLYCLDYTPDKSPDGLGVVLISYTWQDDSAKQIALPSDNEIRIKRLVEDVEQIDADFAAKLVPLDGDYDNNTIFIDWMAESNYHGAFKLNYPKQDRLLQESYTFFKNAGTSKDINVYLAGDDVSFSGGWCEGAIETAINAVSAVGKSLGGTTVTPSVFDGRTTDYDYAVHDPQ